MSRSRFFTPVLATPGSCRSHTSNITTPEERLNDDDWHQNRPIRDKSKYFMVKDMDSNKRLCFGGDPCAICLDDRLCMPSKLDMCKHSFCLQCIVKWSAVSNKCPLCKCKFKRIMSPSGRGRPVYSPRRYEDDDELVYDSASDSDLSGFIVPDDEAPSSDDESSDDDELPDVHPFRSTTPNRSLFFRRRRRLVMDDEDNDM